MQFKTFMLYQCRQYLLRWRWLLPVAAGLLLGYWAGNIIGMLKAQAVFSEASASLPSGGALEAFIWAFGKPEIVYFVITAIYIYLVSDYLPGTSYEQAVLLRLGSRNTWWVDKVFLVFVSTIVYTVLLFGSFLLMVLWRYPLSVEWSPFTRYDFGMGLGYAIKNGTPIQAVLSISTFLILGWCAIGLLILTVTLLTRKNTVGFLAGALVVVLSISGSVLGGPIGGEGWMAYLLIQNHLEYTPLWSPVRVIPEYASWIFWLIWISLCFVVGWFSSKRTDFFAIES